MSDFDWMDMALFGSLSEELSQEDRRRLRMLLDGDAEGECDCCCAEDDPFEPSDYDP